MGEWCCAGSQIERVGSRLAPASFLTDRRFCCGKQNLLKKTKQGDSSRPVRLKSSQCEKGNSPRTLAPHYSLQWW
jgi:hypothetical protein